MKTKSFVALCVASMLMLAVACDPDDSEVRVTPSSPAAQSPSASPEVSLRSEAADRCADLPFAPTWAPHGWSFELHPGDGGQVGTPLDEQNPQSLGHYTGEEIGRFVGVYEQGAYYSLAPDAEKIQVFWYQDSARFGDVHEGFAVEFEAANCAYSLIAFGLDRDDFRRFVDGLILVGGRANREAFALWPEQRPEEAIDACREGVARRQEPLNVATSFASDILGIDGADVSELEKERGGPRFLVLDDAVKAAIVSVDEIAYRCWAVTHVTSARSWNSLGNFSWRNGRIEVLADDPGKHGAVAATLSVLLPSRVETSDFSAPFTDWFRLDVGAEPNTPSAFLIVFRGRAGRVVGAYGHALPTYDTAAG